MSAAAPPAARPGAPVKGKGKGPPPPKALSLPLGKGAGKAGKTQVPYTGPKLRPLFWQTMSQVPQQSVWTDLRPPARFDESLLEKQFALSQPRSGTPANGGDSTRRAAASNDEGRKRLRILDEKSSHFLAIAFNRLPPPESLGEVLQTLQEFPECLHPEAVLALHNAAGEQQEAVDQIRQLDVAPSDLAQLGEAERYLWVLSAVPLCSSKLACGALLIAHSRDLSDLSVACDRVAACCEELKSSELIRRTVSTSLAVGNVLNRGTARSEARAVCLPEGLLKFEELRGSTEAEENEGDAAREAGRCPTLLDFVARALVEEDAIVWAAQTMRAFPSAVAALKEQTTSLKSKALLASKADLDEAENLCKKVTETASKASGMTHQIVAAAGSHIDAAESLAARVQKMYTESQEVSSKLQQTKDALKETQTWFSTKSSTKGSEWFASWATFLDQLNTSFSRARPSSALSTAMSSQGAQAMSATSTMTGTASTSTAAPATTAATTESAKKAAEPVAAPAVAPVVSVAAPASVPNPPTTDADNGTGAGRGTCNHTSASARPSPSYESGSCAVKTLGTLQGATVGVGIGIVRPSASNEGTTQRGCNAKSDGTNNNANTQGSLSSGVGGSSRATGTTTSSASTTKIPVPVSTAAPKTTISSVSTSGTIRTSDGAAKAQKVSSTSRSTGVKLDDDARLDRNALSMLLSTPTPQTANIASSKAVSNKEIKSNINNISNDISSNKSSNSNSSSSNAKNSNSNNSSSTSNNSQSAAKLSGGSVSTSSRLEMFRPALLFGRGRADKENQGQ